MILVANYIDKNQDKIGQMAAEFMRDLASHGIPVVETSNNNLNITIPHVYITFVTDLNVLRGRKFNEIFGPVPNDVRMGCVKRPYRPFIGSLLDYVMMCEDIGGC